ncbi:MAG: hypothetical protein ABI700_10410 [Chloroflexota bacterium]
MPNNQLENTEPVIACNFGAIAPADREAHATKAEDVFTSVLEVKELEDGYGFRLPLETPMLHTAIEFIANERLCCSFFTFTLVVGEELWLHIGGLSEVKEYVKVNLVDALVVNTFPDKQEWIAAHTPIETP